MATQENPIGSAVPIIIAVILGGAGIAAAKMVKKKPAPVMTPTLPGYPMPEITPSAAPRKGFDINKFTQDLQKQLPPGAEKITKAAALKAAETLFSGGSSQQVVETAVIETRGETPQEAASKMGIDIDWGSVDKPTQEEKIVNDLAVDAEKAAKAPAKGPGLEKATKAIGTATTAKAGASVLGVGLGTIAIVAGVAAVAVAGVESIRRQQRKQKKHRDQKKAFNQQALQYVYDRNKVVEDIKKLSKANAKLRAGIAALQRKLDLQSA